MKHAMRTKTLGICWAVLLAAGCGSPSSGDSNDPNLASDIGVTRAGLHKGTAGAQNGDANYCDDPNNPCAAGEGDCDKAAQCEAGLVCGRSKLTQFGFAAGDACVPAHCTNKVKDADETQIDCGGSCGTTCPPLCAPNGSAGRCNSDCLCGSGEGQCTKSDQCASPLVCGIGKLTQFGFPSGNACVPTHCANNVKDGDETQIDCGGSCGTTCGPLCKPNGAANRCNSDCLCNAGEGECTSDDQCAAGLVCGKGKLTQFGFPSGNACIAAHCANNTRDADETAVDCGGECGSVGCSTRGCDQDATYEILVKDRVHEQFNTSASAANPGCQTWDNAVDEHILEAKVSNGVVTVTGGGFSGTYSVVEDKNTVFKATATSGICEDYADEPTFSGQAALSINCKTRIATFHAKCIADYPDTCFPNYTEVVSGTGTASSSGGSSGTGGADGGTTGGAGGVATGGAGGIATGGAGGVATGGAGGIATGGAGGVATGGAGGVATGGAGGATGGAGGVATGGAGGVATGGAGGVATGGAGGVATGGADAGGGSCTAGYHVVSTGQCKPILFSDDFNSGVLPGGWQLWRKTFAESGGEIHVGDSPRPGFNYGAGGNGRDAELVTHIGDASWTDYRLDLDAQALAAGSYNPYWLPSCLHRFEINFRMEQTDENWNNPTTGYTLDIQTETCQQSDVQGAITFTSNHGITFPALAGSTRTLVQTNSPAIADGPNHYAIEVVGNNVKLWVNGSPVFDYTDNVVPYATGASPITYGGINLTWIWEVLGWADNVVVTDMR